MKKYFQNKKTARILFGCLSFLLVMLLVNIGYSSYQVHRARQIVIDFQNIHGKTAEKYKFENLKEDIEIVRIGKVPSFVCRKLVHAYFAYPHRIYADNKYIPIGSSDMCYEKDELELVFQFSKNKWSYHHKLDCEDDSDCRQGICVFGVCVKTDSE